MGFPALLVALKLGEFRAQDRVAHLRELLGHLTCADRLHQPPHRVQRPLGIVVSEGLVVRELVADIEQLRNIGAFRVPQHRRESLLPERHHGLEQALLIPTDVAGRIGLETLDALHDLNLPVPLERGFQPLFDERDESFRQKLHTFEHILARTLGHCPVPLRYPAGSDDPRSCRGSLPPAASVLSSRRSMRCRPWPPSHPSACWR